MLMAMRSMLSLMMVMMAMMMRMILMMMMRKVNDEDAWVCTGWQILSTGYEEQTFIIMLHQTEASTEV